MPRSRQDVAGDTRIRQRTADRGGHADRLEIGFDRAGDPRGDEAVRQGVGVGDGYTRDRDVVVLSGVVIGAAGPLLTRDLLGEVVERAAVGAGVAL